MTPTADLIIENARIFTSNKDMPQAEAVATKGNRILFVGSSEEVQKFKDSSTRVIDGQGHTLTPGFIDSHFHLLWGAIWSGAAQLYEVKSLHELKNVLLEHAEKNKTTEWVEGRGIRYNVVATRHELDAIISDRPVYINAYDGHTSWANTKALELAGVLQPGREADGIGVIVRDENGMATGELRETATDMVSSLIPLPNEARKRELLKITMRRMNAAGVTSIHNMNGDMEELMTFAAVEDAGEMTVRVYEPYHIKPETTEDMLAEAAEMAKVKGEFVRGGAAKFFMDGVWESYTAMNIEPYADNPEATPDPIFSLEHFTRMATLCDQMGLQIAVHCCGDGAVRQTLNGYEAVQKSNGKRDSRHRIEHIEVIHPDDIPRFKELGVIPSMQTSHAPSSVSDEDIWPTRVGKQRWHLSFAWRELLNAGNQIAFGSDWPVAPFDPMVNLNAGLNREKWDESNPAQNLTLAELITGYTRHAAYTEFMEHQKGQVREGYLADLVLFSHDLFALDPKDIQSAKPVLTIVNGNVVFEA